MHTERALKDSMVPYSRASSCSVLLIIFTICKKTYFSLIKYCDNENEKGKFIKENQKWRKENNKNKNETC